MECIPITFLKSGISFSPSSIIVVRNLLPRIILRLNTISAEEVGVSLTRGQIKNALPTHIYVCTHNISY